MSKIFVCGLVNLETDCAVDGFPISYSPVDYNFYGIRSVASGVGLNVSLALSTLSDEVTLMSYAANDAAGAVIREAVRSIARPVLLPCAQTPQSCVLFDHSGARRVYTDLKDMQERALLEEDFRPYADADAYVICNINFARPLLTPACATGRPVFTDVHCLSDVHDPYNADFMRAADVLFMSNEHIRGTEEYFVRAISATYPPSVIVVGMGADGALLYERKDDRFTHIPAMHLSRVVNTVGAGDALFSAFTHFFLKGEPPARALTLATAFASVKIGCSGASNGFLSETELYQRLY